MVVGVIFCHVGLGLNLGHLLEELYHILWHCAHPGYWFTSSSNHGFKLITRPIGQRHGHTGSRKSWGAEGWRWVQMLETWLCSAGLKKHTVFPSMWVERNRAEGVRAEREGVKEGQRL